MSDVNQQETDSEKRPIIEADSDLFYMKVVGAEGETTKDVKKVFDEEFKKSLESVQENIEKIEDRTFR